MTDRTLRENEWRDYFAKMSKKMPSHQVRIEALATDLGDQVDAEGEVVTKIEYDPSERELLISSEHRGHVIRRPKEIRVREEAGDLAAMEVIDSVDVRYVITLEPLEALPR